MEIHSSFEKTTTETQTSEPVMKPLKGNSKYTLYIAVASFLVVVAGVGTGWLLAGGASGGGSINEENSVAVEGVIQQEDEAGIKDTSDFDAKEVEGMLVEGGIEGEGTHHLEREGGPSKYVYLNSSVVDLQSFVGKRVQIWGDTVSGGKAGWLVDVGKIKVVKQ